MSNNFNNKRLLYLLLVLVAILVLTVIVKIPKERATLKSKLVDLDTSAVSKIILYPRVTPGKTVEFNRVKGKWTVQQDNIISATADGSVQNLLSEVLRIKPQSLASRDRSKWNEFDLSDSLATRIKFLDRKGKVLTDLMIGKFTYKQPDNPYAGYSGNNIQLTSFVRIYNENEVYAVDGPLTFSFNLKFEDWRDKTFLRSKRNDITNIRFIYTADSSFSLVKKANIWQINDLIADSATVANYLASLDFLNGESIKDNFKPDVSPLYQLKAEGNNLMSFSIRCYTGAGEDEFILNSSQNPDVYFAGKRNGIFDKIFKSQKHFYKQVKKQ